VAFQQRDSLRSKPSRTMQTKFGPREGDFSHSGSFYLNDAVMIFKCIHNLVPDYLAEKVAFRSQINIRNTRQSNHLNILRCRLATGQRPFSYCGAKLWNNLSNDLKNVNSVKAFKSKLTKQLFLT